MQKLFLVSLFFLLSNASFGQRKIDLNDLLLQQLLAIDTTTVALPNTFKPSYLEKIDLRTETDEFDIANQRYSIRLSPSTAKIRKAQRNLYQLYQEKGQLTQQRQMIKHIDRAYENVLNIFRLSKEISLQQSLLEVLKDEEKVYQKLIVSSAEAPEKWLDLQQEIAQIEIELFDNQQNITHLAVEGATTLDWATMISAEKLVEQLSMPLAQNSYFLEQKRNDLELALVTGEIQLEQAESRNLFDFIQLEYQDSKQNAFREQVAVTAAFQIPFSSNAKLKIAELNLEKISAQQKIEDRQFWKQQKEKDLVHQLQLDTEIYQRFQTNQQANEEQFNVLLETYDQYKTASPLLLLHQKKVTIQQQMSLLKMEHKLYQTYLEYLQLTEQLYQLPLRNCLMEKE
ncbi:MAG: hypothetical protein AAFP82_02175 [Bacteroidota bacterium]